MENKKSNIENAINYIFDIIFQIALIALVIVLTIGFISMFIMFLSSLGVPILLSIIIFLILF